MTWGDQTMTIQEWSERVGISRHVLTNRLNAGWDVESALKTPLQKKQTLVEWQGEAMTLFQWSKRLGISQGVLWDRIHRRGWTPDKAFTAPANLRLEKNP